MDWWLPAMQELGPAYVRTVKEAVGTAVERQRRRRLPGPLLLPGLCLPKALAPLVPIYLQGVLQVRHCSGSATSPPFPTSSFMAANPAPGCHLLAGALPPASRRSCATETQLF